MITACAVRAPDAIAVAAGWRFLTYRHLDLHSNRLARRLGSSGVTAESLVGLYLPHSPETVIGALGILKSGGICMPFEPSESPARGAALESMQALVTNPVLAETLTPSPCRVVVLNGVHQPEEVDDAPRISIQEADMAYAGVTHRELSARVVRHCNEFAVTATDRATYAGVHDVDAFIYGLWPYLAAGASVHFSDDAITASSERLRGWLLAQAISVVFVGASIAPALLSADWPRWVPLRLLLTGGDPLPGATASTTPFRVVKNYPPDESATAVASDWKGK
jgi:non-ribosomal peptide synthetase component F